MDLSLYLIQRGTINRDESVNDTSILSDAVRLQYMGSAEFEFGALPDSLRRIRANFEMVNKHLVGNIRQDGTYLRLFSYFPEDKLKKYIELLTDLRFNTKTKIRLKEGSYFTEFDHNRYRQSLANATDKNAARLIKDFRTDFWWDIDNDTMFTFDSQFAEKLPGYLANSFKVLKDKPVR